MSIQLVNVGVLPNDQQGDPLRVAFQKINNNFIYLQQTSSNITSAVTVSDTPDQVVFEYPADELTQGQLQIQSYRQDNNDSQNALVTVQLSNDESTVKYTVYGTTSVGNWLTTYSMDVSGGNVRLLVSPLQNTTIQHFIMYTVTYAGDLGLGVPLLTENNDNLLTEQGLNITTEN
jgi:hypothetical protein